MIDVDGVRTPKNAREMDAFLDRIRKVLDPSKRLPELPFLKRGGVVAACDNSYVLGSGFGKLIASLAETYGDESIVLICLDPTPDDYLDFYGTYPAFEFDAQHVGENYFAATTYEPKEGVTGGIRYMASVVAVVGSSGEWAGWAQWEEELGLIYTPRALEQSIDRDDIPFVTPEVALDSFWNPSAGLKVPFSQSEQAVFLRNIAELENRAPRS